MPPASLRVYQCLPAPAGWREAMRVFQRDGPANIVALNASAAERLAVLGGEAGSSFLDFEAAVGRALDHAGMPPGMSVASATQERLAVAAACGAIPEGDPFRQSASYTGFHERLIRTLHELRAWGVDEDALGQAAERCDPDLGAKLSSLAAIARRSREMLATIGRLPALDRVLRCVQAQAPSTPWTPKLLAFAGSEESPVKLRWLQWCAQSGAEVGVVFDGHQKNPALFAGAERAIDALGVSPERLADAGGLAGALFTTDSAATTLEVNIADSPEPLAECEWALREALAHIAKGIPASKIAVFARNIEEYGPLLEAAALRLEVGLALRRPAAISTVGYVRFVLGALAALCSGDAAALRLLADSSYCGAPGAGLLTGACEDTEGWLGRLFAWRSSHANTSATLNSWIDALRDLLGIFEGARAGDSALEERDAFAMEELLGELALRSAVGHPDSTRPLSLGGFLRVASAAARDLSVSLVCGTRGVRVVSRADGLGEVDALIVLGLVEGTFPKRRSEDPVLSDAERQAVSHALRLSPSLPESKDTAARERGEFVSLCAAPSRSLTLSFSLTDEDRDNVPTYYLSEVRRAMGDRVTQISHPRNAWTAPEGSRVVEADRRLAEALAGPRSHRAFTLLKSEELLEKLRPSPEESFSPSELRDAAECPFRFTFRRRLGLEPAAARQPWARLRRLPQAAALPVATSPEEAETRLRASLEEEIEAVRSELSPAALRLMRSWGQRLIREWVRHEFQARDLWPKDKGSIRPHAAFGAPGLAGELPLGKRVIRLRGGATALSSMGAYSVAHLANVRGSLADSTAETMSPVDRLELGLYLWSLWGARTGAAVEAESLSGKRTLFVLPRLAEQPIPARQDANLRVVSFDDKREFFGQVKATLTEALENLDKADAAPCPGEHCRYCGFGEICRSSAEFGEAEMSFTAGGEDD